MTFAVIKTGGKQYKVAANDVVKIEKLDAQPGDVVTFDQVLMVGDGDASPLARRWLKVPSSLASSSPPRKSAPSSS